MAPYFEFQNAVKLLCGEFSLERISIELEHLGASRPLVLSDAVLEKLAQNYVWCEMERVDDAHRAVRFCTSWATKAENVEQFCADLKAAMEN